MKILARLPYGKATDPTEDFVFEEFSDFSVNNKFLWFNPLFVSVLLLARNYLYFNYDLSHYTIKEVENLPLYTYRTESEQGSLSCAELYLTENNVETLLNYGFMPLISFKGTDKIRLPILQSITASPLSLIGR
jgi:type VI secretion system protein ImpC